MECDLWVGSEPWWRGWWRFRTCPPWWEHKAPALNPSLVMNGVILGYDDDGDHVPELGVKGVHEHVQPLREDTKIRTQSTKSALSDRLISTEMLLYLSTSDVQYFLKSVLYFIHICMFWFLGNQVTSLALVLKLSTRLYNLHCHIALDCPIGIIS